MRLVTSSSVFESIRSRILPIAWVGWSINCISELLKIKSQKAFDEVEVEKRVCQLMSGKLKSPVIMTCVDRLDWAI